MPADSMLQNLALYNPDPASVVSAEAANYRLARELHDCACQNLISLKMAAERIRSFLPDNQQAADAFSDLLNAADTTLHNIRTLSHDLSPVFVIEDGLAAAIAMQIEQLTRNGCLRGRLQVIGQPPPHPSPCIDLHFYRIFQELLSNIIKHARATKVSVVLLYRPDLVTMQITDDGIGMNTTCAEGMGLRNIRQRTRELKGSLLIHSEPNGGTEILIEAPVSSQEPE